MGKRLPQRFKNKINISMKYILDSEIKNDINKIILFGSCSTGNFTSTSDIDLCIVTNNKIIDRRIKEELRDVITDSVEGVEGDLVFYTHDNLIHSDDRFTEELRTGIILWEKGNENYESNKLL